MSRDAELRFLQVCSLASQCACLSKLSVHQIISVTHAALTWIFSFKKVLQNNNHTVQLKKRKQQILTLLSATFHSQVRGRGLGG